MALLLSITLLLSTTLNVSIGAPRHIADSDLTAREGATHVRGYLAGRHDRHYLGLHVSDRLTTVTLTLTVNLIGSTQAGSVDFDADTINFLVLTELGLQRFLTGADPWDVNLAAGTRRESTSGDGTLQLATEFRAVGRGGYTVLVFNAGDAPITYHLQVTGGQLIDGAGQTYPAGNLIPVEQLQRGLWLTDPSPARLGQSAPTLATLPIAGLGKPAAAPFRSDTLGGHLPGADRAAAATHHYFVLEPAAQNGDITISLAYENDAAQVNRMSSPASPEFWAEDTRIGTTALETTPGGVNYWVFTEAGARQLDQGAPAEFLSLASGSSFLGVPNLLRTRVRLTGETAYVVVIFNQTGYPIDYRVRVEGANLVDLYGQSTEAQLNGAQTTDEESDEAHQSPEDRESLTAEEPASGLSLPDSSFVLTLPPAIARQLEPDPSLAKPHLSPREVESGSGVTGSPLPNHKQPDQDSGKSNGEAGEPFENESPNPGSPAPYRLPLYHTGYSQVESTPAATTRHTLSNLALDTGEQSRWTLQPDGAFARAVITLADPTANADLRDVQLWVVSKEGLRRMEAGVTPDQATVAGFTALRLGRTQSVLQVSFDAAGYESYTVIIENAGNQPVTFRLHARNSAFMVAEAGTALESAVDSPPAHTGH